nr:2A [Cosavirus A]
SVLPRPLTRAERDVARDLLLIAGDIESNPG